MAPHLLGKGKGLKKEGEDIFLTLSLFRNFSTNLPYTPKNHWFHYLETINVRMDTVSGD